MPYTKEEQRAHREQLVEALRSGDYEQGTNCLLRVDGDSRRYCCLGVACEISGLGEWKRSTFSATERGYVVDGHCSGSVLPAPVREYYGFRTESGDTESESGDKVSLVDMNDGELATFEQIADVIEAEPRGLIR